MKTLTAMLALVFALSTWTWTKPPSSRQQSKLISFKLKDQFDREFDEKDFHHWILVLTVFDKSGSQYAEPWIQAIQDALEDDQEFYKILLVAVADLRGIPFFLKGFVRGKFPEKRSRWVLLDWKGDFSKAYGLKPKVANILVFDCSSRLIHKTLGRDIDQTQLDAIVAKVQSAMPDCE